MAGAPGGLVLRVTVEGTGTWGLDFWQVTPTNGLMMAAGLAPVANGAAVVLDGPEGRGYVLDGNGNQLPYVAVSGQPIELAPGLKQTLVVLAETATGVEIGDTMSVRVWVRPRRLVV
jgi:hypothetical protein